MAIIKVKFDDIGGGGVGDYTKFKQGTFTTSNGGTVTVNDVGFEPKHLILIPRTAVSSGTYNVLMYDETSPNCTISTLWNTYPTSYRSGSVNSFGFTGTGYGAISEINSSGFKVTYTDLTTIWDYYAYG